MTQRAPHQVRVDGRDLAIREHFGVGLYNPEDDGVVFEMNAGGWRGHRAVYEVRDGELRLRRLAVSAIQPPPIDGVEPTSVPVEAPGSRFGFIGVFSKPATPSFEWVYEGLDRRVPFTGWMSAGSSLLQRRVLVFSEGRQVIDRAEQRRVIDRGPPHAGALSLLDGSGELSIPRE